ncbi:MULTISPECIES: hypothetical protein [Shewanella]|uniref:hypothetical protein n=1 Tax=Shewanella TaxID=22 RepID=UPI001F5E78EE|nr:MULTISPECIES: hypothetical protein [Shewanella]
MKSSARGQASIEYLVVCGALVAALLTPVQNDMSVLELCVQALREWYTAFAYTKSLTVLPGQ